MKDIYLKGIFAPVGKKGSSGFSIDKRNAARLVKKFNEDKSKHQGILIGSDDLLYSNDKEIFTHEVISLKLTEQGIEGVVKILDTKLGRLVKTLICNGYRFRGDTAIEVLSNPRTGKVEKYLDIHTLHLTMQFPRKDSTSLYVVDKYEALGLKRPIKKSKVEVPKDKPERFFGKLPSYLVDITKHYKDQHDLVITVEAGPKGWTILWADQSSTFEDINDTSESNFNRALEVLKEKGFTLTELEPINEVNEVRGEVCEEA